MPYEVSIKSRKQQILLVDVEETDTVAELKKKIKSKLGAGPESQQPLFFNGVELADDEASLLEYDVVPDDCPGGPIVTMGRSPWTPFRLQVELPGGRIYQELVSIDTTVAQVKGRITSEVGIPYLAIKLYAKDTLLKDRLTLADAGVAPGSKIRLSTGMPLYAGPAGRLALN
mmetsp:Transcript_43108/g.138611  ORF Transcript_43108/g.138611 Transcript_43108/m.138611 type:complete len:172 (+) Transcript_43108:88-603(+)|eukprot:CAMPEP_0177204042 /NCGR_PEP_ID=MMETSP0367-20130122/28133_1 /TAXON_ID=447022 ORGANISM="Scrippsiella hangoei-like, Strain SHHI-4" /NCGR_SAMPLE_ID=MMETSP0367 /ASSEMBLY_ACC=CAM_ASM_000362 /LENGTH=171 /DNA_ID=CAMNT_0018652705 /DNA_START=66 /DNA_END=581 /DNA_ORIENTATION=-